MSPASVAADLEQRHVAAAGGQLDAAGVRDRCEVRGVDFFEAVPPGGDADLLANIVRDWGDDDAVQILTRAGRRARRPRSRPGHRGRAAEWA
ncbi:MAG: methyltransferase [Nocardioidaceae bacterium]